MAKERVSSSAAPAHSEPIDVKQAVRRARAFLMDLYEGEELPNQRLEEVERSENGDYWMITLGFTGTEKEFELGAVASAVGLPTSRPRREYKLVRVDAYSGEPESMKIREP